MLHQAPKSSLHMAVAVAVSLQQQTPMVQAAMVVPAVVVPHIATQALARYITTVALAWMAKAMPAVQVRRPVPVAAAAVLAELELRLQLVT